MNMPKNKTADARYEDPCKIDFEVWDEFACLLPDQTDAEHSALRTSIIAEDGLLDPLKVAEFDDENGKRVHVLIDGHNRLSICQEEGFAVEVRYIQLNDKKACLKWILDNQAARRNMTKQQIDYLRGSILNETKAQGKRTDITSPQFEGKLTAEKIAEESGVSRATIERNAKFAREVDALPAEERKAVLAGKKKLPSAPKPAEKTADTKIRFIVRAIEKFSAEHPDCVAALRDEVLAIL